MKQAAVAETEQKGTIIPAATALMTHEQAGGLALAEELTGFTGLEGLDPSTVMIIPRIKIVQPTSKEGTEGKLRINLTGDEFDEIPLVLIKALQGRTYWDPDPKSDKVLCRSYDFMIPDSSIEKPFNDTCAVHTINLKKQRVLKTVCHEAQWTGSADSQKKPTCAETFNLLCIQAEDLLPFWITLAGVSLRPAKSYISAIALRRCPLWQWHTVLSTEKRTEPQKHYVAKFGIPRPLAQETLDQITRAIVELQLQSADIRKTFEAEETAGVAGDEAPGGAAAPDAPNWLNGHEGA
jgi:hypothetical protein